LRQLWRLRYASLCLLLLTTAAHAQDAALDAATALWQGGDTNQAIAVVDAYLEQHANDPQGRFLKALMLSDGGDVDTAINLFVGLSLDFPNSPEPFNNLAVLYVGKGAYALAANALRSAINADPGYVTAHENLGDLYLRMALNAYGNALRLEAGNDSLRIKRAQVRKLLPDDAASVSGAVASGTK
jgi:Flp pilus assembly protein TadD